MDQSLTSCSTTTVKENYFYSYHMYCQDFSTLKLEPISPPLSHNKHSMLDCIQTIPLGCFKVYKGLPIFISH